MSSRVTGGGPKAPVDKPVGSEEPARPADLKSKEGLESFRQVAKMEGVPTRFVDQFEKAGPQLNQTLQALASKIRFTNEELAQVAREIAVFVMKTPNADRKTRAKAFAKAILKRKRFQQIFGDPDQVDERDAQKLEEMFELIADQLDGSPVLAQLVEEVTEGARSITNS